MDTKVQGILAQLSLEEKASLCSGKDFWKLKGLEKPDLPEIMVTDGPHGLRKQAGESDHVGLNESVPATCFPSGAALAASWNTELIKKVGETLGEECRTEQVSVLLGPAVNIKRSPLCGRNFEYYSEDPYLSSQMAKSFIQGVQSKQVGTSIKHFAANNQEYHRLTVDTIVDERTLREIYLASFEAAIVEAQPWTVMCSYNKINGTYASENAFLLNKILREEWGYQGLVVTDWGAANDRVRGIKAGLDLEMPGNGGINDRKIVAAVRDGSLSEEDLDKAAANVLELILKAIHNLRTTYSYDKKVHHATARQVASECMVLLKNEGDILPLKKDAKVLVVGPFAKNPRYQGGGSSHINPTRISDAFSSMEKLGKVTYAEGFSITEDEPDHELVNEAGDLAGKHDYVVFFAGLPDHYESEGYDREHLSLPPNQNALITELAAINRNTIVVLSNGSPVVMPWIDTVPAILEGYLGGQASGEAAADVLYGTVNPSGKLAETFPLRLEDNPSFLNFPGKEDEVRYAEGLFVGYRYYDAKKIAPLFPFGHGLSYTSFEISNMRVVPDRIKDIDQLTVALTLKNTGLRPGKEVVQIYVEDPESSVIRPLRELKAFSKNEIQPGEEKELNFTLSKRAFAYYNTHIKDWHVETGDFIIHAGFSSIDLPLSVRVHVESTIPVPIHYTINSTVEQISRHPVGAGIVAEITRSMPFAEASDSSTNDRMMEEMVKSMPLRQLVLWSNGAFTEEMAEGLLKQLNEG